MNPQTLASIDPNQSLAKKNALKTCNHFHYIWNFLKFYQIFFSPEVQRCAIITYKYGI